MRRKGRAYVEVDIQALSASREGLSDCRLLVVLQLSDTCERYVALCLHLLGVLREPEVLLDAVLDDVSL
jgi:hypothetical protein